MNSCEWPRCREVAKVAVQSGKQYCVKHHELVLHNQSYLQYLGDTKQTKRGQ